MHFEMNFEADFVDFPVVPLHLDKQRLLDHCYFPRFLTFSPSHLRMIAAQMPNLCSLAFLCETFEIHTPEFISALRYLIQRCQSLTFIFWMECKITGISKSWKKLSAAGTFGSITTKKENWEWLNLVFSFYPKEAVLSISFWEPCQINC